MIGSPVPGFQNPVVIASRAPRRRAGPWDGFAVPQVLRSGSIESREIEVQPDVTLVIDDTLW